MWTQLSGSFPLRRPWLSDDIITTCLNFTGYEKWRTEMALHLSNESSKSGKRVTLRLLHPEAYLAQHTAVPITSPVVRYTNRALASPSLNSQDLSWLCSFTFSDIPLYCYPASSWRTSNTVYLFIHTSYWPAYCKLKVHSEGLIIIHLFHLPNIAYHNI